MTRFVPRARTARSFGMGGLGVTAASKEPAKLVATTGPDGRIEYSVIGDIGNGLSSLFGGAVSGAKKLLSPCDLARNDLPVLKDMVKTVGCSAGGKAALATTISVEFPMLAPFSGGIIDACLCVAGPGGIYPPGYVPPQPSIFGAGGVSHGMLIGLAALGLGLVVVMSKKKRPAPAAPIIVMTPSTAAAPATVATELRKTGPGAYWAATPGEAERFARSKQRRGYYVKRDGKQVFVGKKRR